MKKQNRKYILFAVLFTAVFGALAVVFTDTQSEWYLSLEKSPLTPPSMVFGIAWGILYLLLAISYAIVLIETQGKKGKLFLVNGVLLALWCLFFFTLEQSVVGLIILILTFLNSIFLARNSYEVRPIAGYLLIPFVLWLAFATYLNYYIVLMN